MSHHQVIHDADQATEFFDRFVPKDDESVMRVEFLLRKKYLGESGCSLSLGQNIVNKHRTFAKTLRSFEFTAEEPEQIGKTVLLASVNPLNVSQGILSLSADVGARLIMKVAERESSMQIQRVQSLLHSHISKSVIDRLFVDLDVDTKESAFVERVKTLLSSIDKEQMFVIETTNGFHIIIPVPDFKRVAKSVHDLSNETKFKEDGLTKKLIDINAGSFIVPVPGTLQAGFPLRIVRDFFN